MTLRSGRVWSPGGSSALGALGQTQTSKPSSESVELVGVHLV
jgi:hypothetical protein